MQAHTDHIAAIQYCSHNAASEGDLYLQENTIVFICEGEFRFEYGEAAFQVNARQAVFLRKNIRVGYRAMASGRVAAAWMLFPLQNTTVRQFAAASHWPIPSPEVSEKVLVHQPGPLLMTCIASAESYLKDNGHLPADLEKLKLLELLHCLPGSVQDRPILQQLLD